MFCMKDLPTREDFRPLEVYSSLEPSSMLLFYQFLRSGSDLLNIFNDYLISYGISQGRFVVLLILRRKDKGFAPSDLAESAGVTRATMTGLVDGLERDGFVKREHLDEDKRRTNVKITKKGEDLLENIFPDYFLSIANLMSDVTDEEKLVVSEFLSKLDLGISNWRSKGNKNVA